MTFFCSHCRYIYEIMLRLLQQHVQNILKIFSISTELNEVQTYEHTYDVSTRHMLVGYGSENNKNKRRLTSGIQ